MPDDSIRVGIIGLGGNARRRHVPGLRACDQVEIVAVCNRRPASTAAAAAEFGIARAFDDWRDLISDTEIDAVLIGAWPNLHCEATLAALEQGKHVLTEARMAMNADEARRMLHASRRQPELVCQIVPSPFGLRGDRTMKELIASGFLGELREAVVLSTNDALADVDAPLSWRQVAELSGLNMLSLGIVHETLIRWTADPVRVMAQAHAFVSERLDPASGVRRRVGTPDSLQAMTILADGARGLYHISGVTRFGPGTQIHLYGSEGTVKYELAPHERLLAGRRGDADLKEIPLPDESEAGWRVEAEFVGAIRGEESVCFCDFATGLRYMLFTEAVARSIATGEAVDIPPADDWE